MTVRIPQLWGRWQLKINNGFCNWSERPKKLLSEKTEEVELWMEASVNTLWQIMDHQRSP